MKNTLLSTIFTIIALTVTASAGFGQSSKVEVIKQISYNNSKFDFVIATASETGSYQIAGLKLAKGLSGAVAATTDGSYQNLQLLVDGSVNIAFVQADLYNEWKVRHQTDSVNLEVIKLQRTEHVHLITRDGDTEDILQQDGKKVHVGYITSGSNGSYANMKLLEPNYIAQPVFGKLSRITINHLIEGKIDGILRTNHISIEDPILQIVANSSKIHVTDLDDKDLNDDITIGGKTQPIYKFVSVKVEDSIFGGNAEVLETSVYLIFRKDLLTEKQQVSVAEIIATYGQTLFDK
jgi:TRAP-type uncharacterized transport system substrate-binding protein